MMADSLGDLIKQRRAELGMTQARLADLVGKSASAVRSWERGRAAPKGDSTRAALAAVLGVTDDELAAAIGGADISFFSDPGRPIATDPTPTIVQPAADAGSFAEDAAQSGAVAGPQSGVEDEAVLVESGVGSGLESGVEDEAEASSDSEIDLIEPSAEAAGNALLGEDRAAAPSAADDLVEPAMDAGSDPALATEPSADGTPGPVPMDGSESGQEAGPFSEADADSSDEKSEPQPSRQLVGAGMSSTLASSPGAVTRLVARRQTASRPAAILAPPPVVELDPVARDAWLYRRRVILLSGAAIALVVVLRWALAGIGDAIAEVFDNLRTGL